MSSRALGDFLAPSETNLVTVKFCGKRKREVDLLVPGCYWATTKRKKVADVLSTEIKKIKERYSYFKLEIVQDAIRKLVLTKQASKQINKLCDFTLWSVSLVFEAILWGASIRHGVFIRGERLI